MSNISKHWLKVLGAAALATVAVGLSAAPAMARDGHRDGYYGRGDGRGYNRGWDRHYNNWRPYYRPPVRVWNGYYAPPPPVYYAPPPRVYYPPPAYYPAPGLSLGFNFR